MTNFIAGGIVGVLVLFLIVAGYAVGGWIFAVAWNFIAPVFWASAPHLTWIQGMAIGIVCSIFRGLFGGK